MTIFFGRVSRRELQKIREHGIAVKVVKDGLAELILRRSVFRMRDRGERFALILVRDRVSQSLLLDSESILERGRAVPPPLQFVSARE